MPENASNRRRKTKRSYYVLNLDPIGDGRPPIAILNEAHRWCLTLDEAIRLGADATRRGYFVDIVRELESKGPVNSARRAETKAKGT